MSLWGRNNGMWASYQIQQNQNRSIYADYAIQQERIAQGCQTINKTSNVAAVNSGSVVTSLKEGSQDYTCTEKAQCLARASCPVAPPPPPPPPYVAGPGQAIWANMLTTNSTTSTNTFSLRAVTTDSSGNVYVTGFGQDTAGTTVNIPIYDYITTTNNQIILRESTTVPAINIVGSTNFACILIKYNKDGIAQWAVYIDGLDSTGFGIVCDSSGNVYLEARSYGVNSNPTVIYHMNSSGSRTIYGTLNYTPTANGYDIIVIKYNNNGTAQRVSLCGNISTINENINTSTTPISIDSSGNIVYVFNTISTVNIYNGIIPVAGILDFNTAIPIQIILISGAFQMGIVVRADSNLQIQQATKITGSTTNSIIGSDTGFVTVNLNSLCIDLSGNIILCGQYLNSSSTATLYLRIWNNNSSGVTGIYNGGLINNNTSNNFIIKYDSSLSFTGMAAVISQNQTEVGQNITVDSSGNIYATVGLSSSLLSSNIELYSNIISNIITTTTFSPIVTPANGGLLMILKYNPDLKGISLVTHIQPSPTSNVTPNNTITSFGLSLDNNNNLYLGIVFNGGTVRINNGNTTFSGLSPFANVSNITPVLTSTSINNSIIIKYNSNFQGQWATTLVSEMNVAVSGLSIYYDSNTNAIYTTGVFGNYYGNLNIQNFNRISGGNLITDLYAKMITNSIGINNLQGTGYLVKYAA